MTRCHWIEVFKRPHSRVWLLLQEAQDLIPHCYSCCENKYKRAWPGATELKSLNVIPPVTLLPWRSICYLSFKVPKRFPQFFMVGWLQSIPVLDLSPLYQVWLRMVIFGSQWLLQQAKGWLDSFEISEVRVDALFQSSQSLLSDSFLTPNHLQSFE